MRIIPVRDHEGLHGVIRVSRKRQITLPVFARQALDIKPGDKVLIDGHLPIQPGDRLLLTVQRGRILLRPLPKEARGS